MAGFGLALNSMPLGMRESTTCDQGREMAQHAEITQKTGVAIYFCDPHRQYLPKGTDLSVHSQPELNPIALQPSMRPRKRFDFKALSRLWVRKLKARDDEAAEAGYHAGKSAQLH